MEENPTALVISLWCKNKLCKDCTFVLEREKHQVLTMCVCLCHFELPPDRPNSKNTMRT